MKALYIEPLRKPRIIDIPLSLDALQAKVRGMLGSTYLPEPDGSETAILFNDNGIAEGLQLNRVVGPHIIYGPFLLCGVGEEDFTDLPEDLIAKYMEQFKYLEVFIPRPDGSLAVIKIMEEPI